MSTISATISPPIQCHHPPSLAFISPSAMALSPIVPLYCDVLRSPIVPPPPAARPGDAPPPPPCLAPPVCQPCKQVLGFRLIITFVSFTCKGVRVMVCTSATLFAHSFLNKSIGPCLLLLCDDKTDRGAALQGAARTIWRGEYSQPPENIHRSMGKGAITRWQTQ